MPTPLTPADIRTLSRLLDDALPLSPAEREAWLGSLPQAQALLVPTLRDMLSADAGARADRHIGTLPCLAADGPAAERGDRIGAYCLLREIGRGGMGSVWLAARADGHFKREVALKLPHRSWGEGLVERMMREREIVALLEHPNIARLYDAGVDEHGRPFIAMEYIEGTPIDAFCREQGLGVRASLELFVQVVRAVAYAHGRLVIHRDLKPANVLVDSQRQAHLLDFGIAKLLDGSGVDGSRLTQEHGRVMTLHYASPEQITGRTVGVAADIYSLGVLLYELLTDSMPFSPKRRTASALEEAIMEGHAAPASTRVADRKKARALRGDIDAIIAKAMKCDPADRYTTSDALADDIERHLAGAPVRAQPDSAIYRLCKAARRHRVGVVATAAILCALAAGATVALLQAREAALQAKKARAVTEFMAEVFKASTHPVLRASATQDRSTEPLLDHVGQLIDARFASQPDVQAELYGVVGRIYADIGAGGPAVNYARREIALLDRLQTVPSRALRAQLLLADSLRADGRLLLAAEQARRAMDIAATSADPALRAEAQALLARVQVQLGRVDEAAASAEAVERALSGTDAVQSIALAWAGFVKAEVFRTRNDFDAALPAYQRAMSLASRFEGADSPALVEMQLRLDQVLIRLNRPEQARAYFEAARDTLLRGGGSGQVRAAAAGVAHWAQLYDMRAMPFDEAVAQIEKNREALAARAQWLPPIVTANIEYRLGVTYLVRGELARAAPLIEAHAATLMAWNEQPAERLYVTATRGHLAMMMGDHDQADRLLRAVIALRQLAGQSQLSFAAFDWTAVAQNLSMQGLHEEAEKFLADAPNFAAASGDRLNSGLFPVLVPIMRAQILLERGDAESALDRLQPLTQGLGIDTNSLLRSPHAIEGAALCAAGKPVAGLQVLQASIRTVAEREGERHPGLARLRALAGLCALRAGDRALARRLALAAELAFAAQPASSAYFKAPLLRLERELQATAATL